MQGGRRQEEYGRVVAKVIRARATRVWLGDGGCDESKEADGGRRSSTGWRQR